MFFFFFQAEDGIRDVAVTGVQTCALPISDGTHQRNPGDRCRGLARPAAAAGPEPRQLRRLRSRKERDVCAARTPAGTRGAAIDPRRLHGVDERTVVAPIARQHDAPAALHGQVGNDSGMAHETALSAGARDHLSGFDLQTSPPDPLSAYAERGNEGIVTVPPLPGGRGGQEVRTNAAGPRPPLTYIQGSSADGP